MNQLLYRSRHDHHHHHDHYVDQTANICDIIDDNNNVMNIGSPLGKFKGVVPQQNGNWGAQIYANHQRIWLGTFKSEKAAAMAYDSATIKLQNGDINRNFPWTNITLHEPDFQSHYTVEAVLNMMVLISIEIRFIKNEYGKKEVVEINSVSTTNYHDQSSSSSSSIQPTN
ncbi:ethylene-responsive transcription factor CRF2-like [Cannabis sativa]|uniref:ethylene-responsive transcription factor CRF2-like n=1 Tax=Cannabis sativa TaxID=3483 RepID=UPI0029CA5304|nr:ethylene-responsive transcription factor CRF2-like [Cannabis sativa]